MRLHCCCLFSHSTNSGLFQRNRTYRPNFKNGIRLSRGVDGDVLLRIHDVGTCKRRPSSGASISSNEDCSGAGVFVLLIKSCLYSEVLLR